MNEELGVAFQLPRPVSPPGAAQSLYLYPYPRSTSRARNSLQPRASSPRPHPPSPLGSHWVRSAQIRSGDGSAHNQDWREEATPTWRDRLGLVSPQMGAGTAPGRC